MSRFLALVAVFSLCLSMQGQRVLECWKAMPDALLPYLDACSRTAMVEQYDITQKADNKAELNTGVANRLRGTSTLDTLTTNYLRLRLNDRATWEMKLIATDGDNFVIATSMTVFGDSPESKVSLFSSDWKHLSDTIFTEQSLVKPDEMSSEEYQKLTDGLSLVLWEAHFSPDNDDLTLSPSLLFVPSDEKERYKALKMQKFLKFDGNIFNQY